MGTRSYLIAAVPGTEARLIYCHSSSHTFKLGKTLNEHYGKPETVRELMEQGDASSISATVARSIFHHRDHGEPLERDVYPSVRQALEAINPQKALGIEYVYLFKDAQWAFMTLTADGLTEPMPITPETMADDLAARLEPKAHEEHIGIIAGGDQALAGRLRNRIQATLEKDQSGPRRKERR